MDTTRPISFLDAVRCLKTMLEKQVQVEFNVYDKFVGGGFEGVLQRVEMLPPDNSAIRAVVGEDGGFFLDPESVKSYLVADPEGSVSWLEFEPPHGCSIVVKEAETA